MALVRRLAAVRLRAAGVGTPFLDSTVLISEVLGVDVAQVAVDADRHLTSVEINQFERLVQRRVAREPVAYIVGRKAFADGSIHVTPDVLVPRPETEVLVTAAIETSRALCPCMIVDVGTGSGAVAVAIANALPGALVVASDLSCDALMIAQHNVRAWRVVPHVRLVRSDGVRAMNLSGTVVAANLPYIPSGTLKTLEPEVSVAEPSVALDGGPDGLNAIRGVLHHMGSRLPLALLLEIGHDQRTMVTALAAAQGLACHAIHPDLDGHPRVLQFRPVGGRSRC